MRVFVAGATGVAGRRVVALLVEEGHDVTAVVRSPAKADLVRALGAAPASVDLFDARQVLEAVEGHDAIANLATKIPPVSKALLPGAWAENDRIRTQASRNLVDAAIGGKVDRYVQESLAFMYPDRGDAWIDEDVLVEPPPHTRSMLDAEAQARRFSEAGGVGVILRFGQFYADDAPHTISMVKLARKKVCPLPGPPEAFSPTIHIHDVATAVFAALSAPSGVFNIVDNEPLRQRELGDILGKATGAGPLRFPPSTVMQMGGSKVRMLMRSQRVSNDRFRKAADWTPTRANARKGFSAVIKEVSARVSR